MAEENIAVVGLCAGPRLEDKAIISFPRGMPLKIFMILCRAGSHQHLAKAVNLRQPRRRWRYLRRRNTDSNSKAAYRITS